MKQNYIWAFIVFALTFFLWQMAVAAPQLIIKAQMLPAGELEIALNGLIDAFKVGQVGVIILAIVQLLKTRFVLRILAGLFPAAQRLLVELGDKVRPDEPAQPEPQVEEKQESSLGKFLDASKLFPKIDPSAEIKTKALPVATVGLGALAGVAESLATGKPASQAIFEGLLSSGASMALYDLVLKPIIKKFSK